MVEKQGLGNQRGVCDLSTVFGKTQETVSSRHAHPRVHVIRFGLKLERETSASWLGLIQDAEVPSQDFSHKLRAGFPHTEQRGFVPKEEKDQHFELDLRQQENLAPSRHVPCP